MKVRIRKTPDVDELDGVRLDDMQPGAIREVSSSIGAWLITERCADVEMRRADPPDDYSLVINTRRETDYFSAPCRRWYER